MLPGVFGVVLMQRVATRSEQQAKELICPVNRPTLGALLIGAIVWAIAGGGALGHGMGRCLFQRMSRSCCFCLEFGH